MHFKHFITSSMLYAGCGLRLVAAPILSDFIGR